ncbi:MAG TPA: stage II sporulation protein SpoIID [Desulfotomaculum sp.]|nr:MAG: SpoIID/LytB domain protein [Desulfotomaculum sp. 46_80]KUK85187.1 MAG: SpoIID/LytB domain protein [Desulfofundulus kuznetsovii]HAG12206.1 stage II sporulation protein SpoIID [Desulfotomaculum sp.]HBY04410.1 stage II sporulation protein SpoIID [Desulfotomaculum sp.]
MLKKLFFLSLCLLFICPATNASNGVIVEPETIRIGLSQGVQKVEFSVSGSCQLIDSSANRVLGSALKNDRWQVTKEGNQLLLFKNGNLVNSIYGSLHLLGNKLEVGIASGSGSVTNRSGEGEKEELVILGANNKSISKHNLTGSEVLSASGRSTLNKTEDQNLIRVYNGESSARYRGDLEIRPDDLGLTVINELPFEEYIYSVLPSEMPSAWPAEALKAQAVAARSYSLAQLRSYSKYGFDLLASQTSQVYKGFDWENPATNSAVQATSGQIMTYRGQAVDAVFHSSSGGYTENSEDVWSNTVDYLRARPDTADQNNNHYNWSVTYTQEQLTNLINKAGYKFSRVTDLIEVERTSTGARVKKMSFVGFDTDSNPITEDIYNSNAVRMVLGLKSAMITLNKKFDDSQNLLEVTIQGNGWGHGLGMSQYGALGLAKQGYNYQSILKYYYTGVEISGSYGG